MNNVPKGRWTIERKDDETLHHWLRSDAEKANGRNIKKSGFHAFACISGKPDFYGNK